MAVAPQEHPAPGLGEGEVVAAEELSEVTGHVG
jgi:hypothetical protein